MTGQGMAASPHVSVEWLSAYLDDELEQGASRELEEHLSGCEHCRHQLDGLRSVIGGMHDLERLRAPDLVADGLRHDIQMLSQRKRALWQRLEWIGRPRNLVGPLFALVLALAVIMMMYSIGLERASRPPVDVIVPPPGYPQMQLDGRTFELAQPASLTGPGVDSELASAAQMWVERGMTPSQARSIEPASEEWLAVLAALPELEARLAEGRDVVLEWQGEPVRLRHTAQPVEPR